MSSGQLSGKAGAGAGSGAMWTPGMAGRAAAPGSARGGSGGGASPAVLTPKFSQAEIEMLLDVLGPLV